MLPQSEADDFAYTACYCEENVYKLCERLLVQPGEVYAVFVSNRDKQVPLWRQRAGHNSANFTLWDYHVFVVQKTPKGSALVWDLDTTLTIPCQLTLYAELALLTQLQFKPEFQRLYRVVPAHDYLQGFASDRSHMLLKDGSYRSAPPPYPCIIAQDGVQMRLDDYIAMTEASDPPTHPNMTAVPAPLLGTVHTEASFLAKFDIQPAADGLDAPKNEPALSSAQ